MLPPWRRRESPLEDIPSPEPARSAAKGGAMGIAIGTEYHDPHYVTGRMRDGIVARALGRPPSEALRPYYYSTWAQLADACCATGVNPKTNPGRAVELALQTTSDFPLLLGDGFRQIALERYANAQVTHRRIAVPRLFSNFRPHRVVRAGDFPALLEVGEHAEYQSGAMGESGETLTLATYGRTLGVTRRVLVDDNIAAFADLATAAGLRAADFENATFFVRCILPGSGLGPNLADGVAVYDAVAHGNVAGAGALDLVRLGDARARLKAQATPDGVRLNLNAAILLVSPDSQTLAEQLVAQLAPGQASGGRITPIADANLTGTRFYVLAEPAQLSNYATGYLEGAAGLRVEARSGFDFDGVQIRVSLDFACGAVESRAGVTGAGA